jgi:outer membrane immunogenic protein
MKKILGGIVSALLAAPAMAADLPARIPVKASPAVVAAAYNWSGFYIGGHAGHASGDSDWAFINGTTTTHKVSGFVGGIHTGINWQFNQLVLGIEGSVSLPGMEDASTCPVATLRCETDIDHFWRAGVRAGLALGPSGNWLLYGTGGFARAYVESRQVLIATGVDTAGDKRHHHGWYGGGGLEWGVAPNFTIGVEGYFVSMGEERHFNTRDIDLDFFVVQARATYKFNWGGPVVARY